MMKVISAPSADIAWVQAAQLLLDPTRARQHPSRIGSSLECTHCALTLSNPRQRWVGTRQPAINPAFAIAEVVWIMRGRSDAAFLNVWNSRLPEYAGHGATYHGAYGARIRSHFSVDQLDRASRVLSANPTTRQVVLQIWDPRIDLPDVDGHPRSPDIPCNLSSILSVRDGNLEWMQVLRSNDLFLGVPYNWVQFTTLQEVLSGWLQLDLGPYTHVVNSFHLYEHDVPAIRDSLDKGQALPANEDDLRLRRPESDRVFALLEAHTSRLASNDLAPAGAESLLGETMLPEGYMNLLRVLVAEAARRRDWIEIVESAVNDCSNRMLQQLWRLWAARFQ